MPWNWGNEAYYDYGTGGNVYYEGDTVYANGTTVPAEEYADQAEQLATNIPKAENPDATEWLPLGVFVLTQDGVADAAPNMFVQLARQQGRNPRRHVSKQVDGEGRIGRGYG